MPYIKAEKRPEFKELSDKLSDLLKKDPENFEGNLNFVIATVINNYLQGSLNYKTINGFVGALECAKLEVYRRVAGIYEDRKASENGDVFSNV